MTVNPSPAPFRSVGIDCFGPFYVKRGRVTEKRYGCIFTCLAVRAIHIEVLASLDADSLINAIIRFSARRGQPDVIRCDNGTNFVGSSRELSASVDEWNRRVNETLVQKNIEWKFNTPSASHHGGVWERQIRSVRRVMNAIVRNTILDDERLLTVFCEVLSIINSRPITRSSDCPRRRTANTKSSAVGTSASTSSSWCLLNEGHLHTQMASRSASREQILAQVDARVRRKHPASSKVDSSSRQHQSRGHRSTC